ncbi:MAG: cytochrome c biogenesis protein CcsA [Bacteriovoracaceae bacterium]|nr:cytochrome c biogenesis protein CcsA [Bacteriovoracaceae bacterium]
MKACLVLITIFLSINIFASKINELSLDNFARIETLHEGRIKPIDTFSRIMLKEIYGRESYQHLNSNQWLLETIFSPKKAYERKIFKINNPNILTTLGLKSDQKYFNFIELYQAFSQNQEMLHSLLSVNEKDLDPNNAYLKDLYNRFTTYMGLSRSFSFLFKDFSIQNNLRYSYFDLKKIQNPNIPKPIQDYFSITEEDSTLKGIYLFHSIKDDTWRTPWEEMQASNTNREHLEKWNQLYLAYSQNNFSQFNNLSSELVIQKNDLKINLEILQNKIYFSTWIISLYVASFLLIFFHILIKKQIFVELSSLTLYSGAIIHFLMILMRSIILSRPPVSNLYESILFVSFTSVLIGVIYFLKTQKIIGIFLSSILGVTLLYLSQGYERTGDNMGMIVAVLDTNFWLATHVLTISIGYGFALVMSFMAHYYLIQYPTQTKEENRKLHNNIHLTLLFSLFFTVLGTILGGIWADQSWGRFWGWDPKENGALLICLWLLWVAHAKISRHFKDLSYAFFVGLTSVIVILAWFGVNLLNVGLHSYGFSNDTAMSIAVFSSIELCVLTLLFIRAKKFQKELT